MISPNRVVRVAARVAGRLSPSVSSPFVFLAISRIPAVDGDAAATTANIHPAGSPFEVLVRVGGGLTSKAIAANRGISQEVRTDRWIDRPRLMQRSAVANP